MSCILNFIINTVFSYIYKQFLHDSIPFPLSSVPNHSISLYLFLFLVYHINIPLFYVFFLVLLVNTKYLLITSPSINLLLNYILISSLFFILNGLSVTINTYLLPFSHSILMVLSLLVTLYLLLSIFPPSLVLTLALTRNDKSVVSFQHAKLCITFTKAYVCSRLKNNSCTLNVEKFNTKNFAPANIDKRKRDVWVIKEHRP